MSSVFERYRRMSKRKHDCELERTADFIREGGVSVDVIHYRLDEERKAALVFNDKEGPDDVIFFSEERKDKTESFVKGDYFIWNDTSYLIYENIKLVNSNLNYQKQRAVECNVNFKIKGDKHIMGAFVGTVRRTTSADKLMNKSVLLNEEEPLLIIPFIDSELIGERVSIGGKPWRVVDYDAITNQGIMYLYIRRDVFYPDSDEVPVYGNEGDEDSNEDEAKMKLTFSSDEDTLESLVEHTVLSKGGYFVATPRVDVVKRTKSDITFVIPSHGHDLRIETKGEEGEVIEKIYRVVRP